MSRIEKTMAWLVAAGIAVRVFIYGGMAGGPLVGDEKYYLDGGKAIANAVRDLVSFTSPDGAELQRGLVGNGWFMPGMDVVLAPLYLVVPDASLAGARAYLAVFSTALFLAVVLRVRRVFGDRAAVALLVFPGLVPAYAVFGAGAWGDATAGLIIVLLLCRATEVFRRSRGGASPTWRDGAVLGGWSILAVYFRSSVAILVVAVCAVVCVAALALVERRVAAWRRVIGVFALAGVVFVGLLAPWSATVSAAMGERVISTTSLPTVRANTFGDRDLVCFGECDIGSTIWFSPVRYARETARATGESEVAVLAEMSQYARRDVTSTSYARDVFVNTGRYFYNPSRFATLTRNPDAPYNIEPVAYVVSWAMFYAAVVGMLVLLGAVAPRSVEHAWRLLLIKVGIVMLLVQPFVHIAGPRYWTTMAPLLGIGLALLIDLRQQRRDDVPLVREATGRWLVRAHRVLAAFVLTVVVVTGLLAI